ncbi:MAG: Unknown protein [uncultured Sulfurovum sp.]|uniref:Uncharacterized protein n=1 Tax=uncultured Sulfurovum sp. TaxID=269237 RepID=A0A6S6TRB2_9BACT|nr:MAG: Unknown protein [uncultured Sulfurovum sp.]
MKKNILWLKYSFISIVSLIFLIAIFNYKVDSSGLFGNSNYLLKAAEALANGKTITRLEHADQRSFQELIIKNLQVKNDVILLGSSKSMMLRKKFFLNNEINFFNHAAYGGSIEDYISIIAAYESIHKYIPKTVIIGVDTWTFNKYNGQIRWKTLENYYNAGIANIYNKEVENTNNINTMKWKQLINYDYTLLNIESFLNVLKSNGETFQVVDNVNIDASLREPDGSIHYPYTQRYRKEDLVEIKAKEYTQGSVYALGNYKKLDNIKLFEDFIDYLQTKDVKVIFFLTPYHPISYDILVQDEKYKHINIVENYLKILSTKKQIELKGSFNPHKYNFTNKDFFDGMHGHDVVAEKIAKTFKEIRK